MQFSCDECKRTAAAARCRDPNVLLFDFARNTGRIKACAAICDVPIQQCPGRRGWLMMSAVAEQAVLCTHQRGVTQNDAVTSAGVGVQAGRRQFMCTSWQCLRFHVRSCAAPKALIDRSGCDLRSCPWHTGSRKMPGPARHACALLRLGLRCCTWQDGATRRFGIAVR